MKKILITGANGFTGSHLVRVLGASGYEVIPLDQRGSGLKNEVVIDFCDERFPGVLKGLPPVYGVVHLGARIGWDGSTRAELFQPNVLATAQLVHWAKKTNSYFVFVSAALIAGERNPYINDACLLNTENEYLYSKWLAEEIIKMSEIRHAILRISGIFGRNGPSHLRINRAITDVLAGVPPVRYGDGKIKRNYIYVKDLCNIIKYCLDNTLEGSHLVGGAYGDTIAEMLETICNVLLPGSKPKIREGHPGYDQIIELSHILPTGRTFEAAVKDIKMEV
jgi:nucleoside-diphosphate-sugar epimerase